MSERICLKSRLLRAGDPWQVDISAFKIPLTVDQRLYERDLLNFRRKYSTMEDAPEIAAQDMATLTCTSENPRFCKEHLTVRVGLGLFSKELEGQLIGWKSGQSGTVSVKGQPVAVTVEAVRRECLPEVDDALAARCDDPYIRTAKDIYTYCRGKQFDDILEEPMDEACPELSRQTIAASEFQLDTGELEYSGELMVSNFQSGVGQDINSISEEDFRERFFQSREELLASMRASGRYLLQATLLGMASREAQGRPVTQDDYAAWLRRYTDGTGKSEEEARREHPILQYLLDLVGGDYMDELEAITLFRLKEDAV